MTTTIRLTLNNSSSIQLVDDLWILHQYIEDYIITDKHTLCIVVAVEDNVMIAGRKERQRKKKGHPLGIYTY